MAITNATLCRGPFFLKPTKKRSMNFLLQIPKRIPKRVEFRIKIQVIGKRHSNYLSKTPLRIKLLGQFHNCTANLVFKIAGKNISWIFFVGLQINLPKFECYFS